MNTKKFAVFDIDGTLIRWQLYHVVVDRLAKSGKLGKDSYQKIKDARMQWKKRTDPEAFKTYEQILVKSYEAAIQNIPVSAFDSLINEVIEEHKDQVYTFTRDLLSELKHKGYFLAVISGSHEELIEKIAQYYGFDDFVASKYERSDSGFTGKSYIPSFNKAEALKNLIEKHSLGLKNSFAIGDSFSDVSMLEMVENPVAFNPDKELFSVAKQNHWDIVIERKNMVYKLKNTSGKYELQ